MEDDEFDAPGSISDMPGPWFVAAFDGVCSRGGHAISEDDTIRADGSGEYECRECVTE